MADSILTVNHLKKYFKTPKGMLHAVDDVSFSMKRGTTLGIVGESGCGKSILGRSILWLIEPTSGELIFEGKDLLSVKPSEMRHMRKELQIFFSAGLACLCLPILCNSLLIKLYTDACI